MQGVFYPNNSPETKIRLNSTNRARRGFLSPYLEEFGAEKAVVRDAELQRRNTGASLMSSADVLPQKQLGFWQGQRRAGLPLHKCI